MAIYKTYREAVLANGSTKGVFTTRDDWCGGEGLVGHFMIEDELKSPEVGRGGWKECDPADHLETLEDFRDSDKKLMPGDIVTLKPGGVLTLSESLMEVWSTQGDGDDKRFVLQAADDQVETPEEKEAFDAIDTTPNQVGPLSCSEKPNNSEWNGKGLPSVGVEFDFSSNGFSWESRVMLFNDGITCLMAHRDHSANRWHYKCDDPDLHFRKLETPEQREEREVIEQMYFDIGGDLNELGTELCDNDALSVIEALYKAGYRKQ